MPISISDSLLIVLAVAIVTFATRVIAFLLFPGNKKTPKFLTYLGKVLPLAIIGMLIVYCLKSVSVTTFPFGLPELISIGVVAFLHLWKKNSLLSIGGGTVLYMVLVQFVFV